MRSKIKVAYITGFLGLLGTVAAAYIGKSVGEANTMNQVQSVMSNITGNNNKITINDLSEVFDNYQTIQENNKQLNALNDKYYDELKKTNQEINELKNSVKDNPQFNFKNIGLTIDGEEIPINSNKSVIEIDGETYVSKEIVENIIDKDSQLLLKDDNLFIGKIVHDRTALSNIHIVEQSGIQFYNTLNDTFGNIHYDALLSNIYDRFNANNQIIFNTDRKFSLLKFKISASENIRDIDDTGIVIIKANDEVVYTSPEISITTEPFIVEDIPINNSLLLTIEVQGNGYALLIISEAFLYN